MWNPLRKLVKKSGGGRLPAAGRRFAVEALENRLNLSNGAGVGEFAVWGQEQLFESTPLASAHRYIFDEGNAASHVREPFQSRVGREPNRAPGGLSIEPSFDRALTADRLRREPADNVAKPVPAPIVLDVVVVRQPRVQIIVPLTWTIEVVYFSGPPRTTIGPPAAIRPSGLRFSEMSSTASSPGPAVLRGESRFQAPPAEHQIRVGSMPQIEWSSLSAETGEDFAREPSPRVQTATVGPATSIAAYSSREARGTAAKYSDEGGLIDIGGSASSARLANPGELIQGETIQASDEASTRSPQDESWLSLLQMDGNARSDDAGKAARALSESPPLRALADRGEGGMIDLAEISTVHSELAAENWTAVAAAERRPNSERELTEVIQVDSSVGLFRALELATGPAGEVYETTGVSAGTLPDADGATETPISTDVFEVDPAVSGAAAAIPAVLMVGSWVRASRREKKKRKQTASI